MVQAARSGVQNIAEGSQVSATSKKMELKLTQVARASLEELRLDYEDFLRQRGLPRWEADDSRRQSLVDRRCKSVDEVSGWVRQIYESGRSQQNSQRNSIQSTGSNSSTYPCIAANAALVLINVAAALLDRQVSVLAGAFEQEGGFIERLYRVRSARRCG